MTQIGSGLRAYRTIACGSTNPSSARRRAAGASIFAFDRRPGQRADATAPGTLLVAGNVRDQRLLGWRLQLPQLPQLQLLAVAVSSSPDLAVSKGKRQLPFFIVGLTVIQVAGADANNNKKVITTTSDAGVLTRNVPINGVPPGVKRVSWREIVVQ